MASELLVLLRFQTPFRMHLPGMPPPSRPPSLPSLFLPGFFPHTTTIATLASDPRFLVSTTTNLLTLHFGGRIGTCCVGDGTTPHAQHPLPRFPTVAPSRLGGFVTTLVVNCFVMDRPWTGKGACEVSVCESGGIARGFGRSGRW